MIHTVRSFESSRAGARGGALLAAMLVVILVSGLTLTLLQLGVRFNSEQTHRLDDERAEALAEAALDESLIAMRDGSSGTIASAAQPAYHGDGVLWATANRIGTDLFMVNASAMCGSGRSSLERLVFTFPGSISDHFAVFSNQGLNVSSNVFIDSFDSANGDYATQLAAGGTKHVGEAAIVGSNGNIVVDSAVEAWGDLHPGWDSTAVDHKASDISGNLEPLPAEVVLPPVDEPIIAPMGNLTVGGPNTAIGPGDFNYADVEVKTNGHLTIVGPARVVIGDFELESNSTLTLDTASGPIEMYTSGTFDLDSNSTIVTTNKAAPDATLYFTGGSTQEVELDSNSEFYGKVYAPEGSVIVNSNFEVFGAVVADRITLDSNCKIHYDEALRKRPGTGDPRHIPGGWSKAQFPVQAYLIDRRDPFKLLGVAPTALPTPEAAHVP